TRGEIDMTELSEPQLRLLRAAAVVWTPVEAGAPALLCSPHLLDEEESDAFYEDVARRAGLAAEGVPAERLKRDVEPLLRELPDALALFMTHGELEPGRFEYPNPLVALPYSERLVPPTRPELARLPTVTFELTSEHLKLLRGARWDGPAGWL